MSNTETEEVIEQEGTPEDPSVDVNADLTKDNDFNDFVNPTPPVVEEENESDTNEASESTETSEEEASSEEATQDVADTEAPSTEDTPVETEEDSKDAQIERQRLQLLEMARVLAVKREQPNAAVEPTPVEMEFVDFIGEDEEFHTAEALNKLLNAVATKAASEARSQTLKALPGAIAPQIKNAAAATARANQFLAENPDLVPHIGYVSYIMDEINSEGGSKSYGEIYKELGTRVRSGLNLTKGQAKKTRQKSKPTGFAGTTGTRKPKSAITALQKDIDDL